MKTKTKKKKKTRDSSSPSQINDSDFHLAVSRIAVAQICQSVGYIGTETTALETLTDVAVKFLQSVVKSAVTSANSTGRTQSNLFDIIRALEELHYDVGFMGNSDPKIRLTDSSILHDTMKFVYRSREIPFAKPLPRRCNTVPSNPPCFSGKSVHIPPWLPDFPKIGEKTKTIVDEKIERSIESIKEISKIEHSIESIKEISKLPEKRKKLSLNIAGGCTNEIEIGCGEPRLLIPSINRFK